MVELYALDIDAVSVVTVVCVVHGKLQEAFVRVEVYKLNLPFVEPSCGGQVGIVQGDVCQVDRQQVCPYELFDVVVCADISPAFTTLLVILYENEYVLFVRCDFVAVVVDCVPYWML